MQRAFIGLCKDLCLLSGVLVNVEYLEGIWL